MCRDAHVEGRYGTHPTVPIPPQPASSPNPRWIRVGRGTYPFSTYAEASAAYCATIERLGLGVSEAPVCAVLDEVGDIVARVAYNGRIFAVGLGGECDYTRVLHETCAT